VGIAILCPLPRNLFVAWPDESEGPYTFTSRLPMRITLGVYDQKLKILAEPAIVDSVMDREQGHQVAPS
jgi:hypothetical protein